MHAARDLLGALAVVLGAAAVTTVLFQRLRLPVVLGYVLAGVLVGPNVALAVVADPEVVRTLSELGVILVMFALGLDLSLRKLIAVAPTAGLTALVEVSLMLLLGYAAGRAMGWSAIECLFAGGVVAISSTTIVAKAFDEQGVRGPKRDLVIGILLAEDVAAVALLATLTAVGAGAGTSAGQVAQTVGKLVAFLLALVAAGIALVPRLVRAVVRLERPETTLVVSIGLCFAAALLARAAGYSTALGAFVAGVLVAESGQAHRIEPLVLPVRDVFAAVFFVSVGMELDPRLVAGHLPAVAVLTAVVLVGKVAGVAAGAFVTGAGVASAVTAGLTLAQIGEFSFIIAALGRSLGATSQVLYAVAVAVSAVTTLTTPWFIRGSGDVARAVDRWMPRPLQTYASLYASWIERIRSSRHPASHGARIRRLALALALDAGAVAGIVIGTAVAVRAAAPRLAAVAGVGRWGSRALVVAAGVALMAPFAAGVIRVSRRLASTLAVAALPQARGGVTDLAAAPRRALVVTLQIGVLLFVGIPVVAVTQPFLGGPGGAYALAAVLLLLGIAFWRSAANLQGHVRAGALVVAEALASGARSGRPVSDEETLDRVRRLLPGLGEPVPVRLREGSAAAGRTLAQLDLRGTTGATVLAIARGEEGIVAPSAQERLAAGDVLALAGTFEAVDAARRLLQEPAAPEVWTSGE
ncbi:MAG TPA: cation:proton antiporter [Anaeromyxobacteraceae bacterium]|nr:cation:proton antiporter [Anaeromyxobacteraceae bacterium]